MSQTETQTTNQMEMTRKYVLETATSFSCQIGWEIMTPKKCMMMTALKKE